MQTRKTDRKPLNTRVLIAGFTTRHVACSAHAAGYSVCSVDHFCDRDLGLYTDEYLPFDDLESLPRVIGMMKARHDFGMFVPTSGAELLDTGIPLCGCPVETAEIFLDKLKTARFFHDTGVISPEILEPGTFPAMVKPTHGSGGWRNAVITSEREWHDWRSVMGDPPALWQEVVEGTPASVCCIANGREAVAIAANEQVLRGDTYAKFGFSGSVTPLVHPLSGEMVRCAERIAAASGCRGTVGIDFILGKKVYAIEVNPRFQGTVDTVEMATGLNLFSLHVAACRGHLPARPPAAARFATRKILFAKEELIVDQDFPAYPFVADIPPSGTRIEQGGAVVSVYGWGASRRDAILMLDKNIRTVQQYIGRTS